MDLAYVYTLRVVSCAPQSIFKKMNEYSNAKYKVHVPKSASLPQYPERDCSTDGGVAPGNKKYPGTLDRKGLTR
ncbi:MAG: hypothetical protein Q9213_006424 [Squamulea squamosa]